MITATTMNAGFISHPSFYLHEMRAGHPESPDRLQAIDKQLLTSAVDLVLPGALHAVEQHGLDRVAIH